ncbi:MAG: hypothetical protein FWF55_08205 [Treponema sp.]|nr:hypothetical protein [Treponema sp.]
MNRMKNVILTLCAAGFLFWSCDHGQIGGADRTDAYYPTDALFEERLDFLCGVWYSYNPNNDAPMDGYRIREWGDFNADDQARAQALFPGINLSDGVPKTYSTQTLPQNGDYVVLFDDTAEGSSWGYGYMGLVRAINIFNGNKDRGAVIIEYFEKADPLWLSDPDGFVNQGLQPGEKPFFGIYYKALDSDTVQMANAVDLVAMYADKPYYTEQGTLDEAIKVFDVENEAEFIDWGVAYSQIRKK